MNAMRRYAAIVLPRLRIEIARPNAAKNEPLAVVIARPGSTVKDERSLLGNTRISEVSPEAYALGVRPGATIAQARAKAAMLAVRVVSEEAAIGALARIAEAALAFGATTSFDAGEDVVWVDVTGCAHLQDGEALLVKRLTATVRALGHMCRVAIADGPRVAAAVAWFAGKSSSPLIVLHGKNAEAMHTLPLPALPLDADTQHWLRRVGMKTVGDLQSLPRHALGTRLGAQAHVVMALLEGDDRAPLTPYVPPQVPEERVELEYGVTSVEALLFVTKRLADLMAARLYGRAMAAARVELVFSLDRALVTEGESPRAVVSVALPSPLSSSADLLAVLRVRVESFEIAAPVLALTLRVPELAARRADARDLFVAEARAERALPRLVAELSAEIGEDRVGTLELANRWFPEDRACLVPLGKRTKKIAAKRLVSRTPEPSRLVSKTLLSPAPPLDTCVVLARLEAVEWWKKGHARHDYAGTWLPEYAAMGWVEIEAVTGKTWLRGWMD